MAVEIDGTGSDRLTVTGTVSLGGATLSVSRLGGYVHTAGTVYTIVANDLIDPVVGTFSGLAEGATINPGGNLFRISYAGGDGNDVTLTAIGPATHFTLSAPASATAGTAFSFTVTALDQFNNPATGYAGTVHFTSSDGAATLPANSTLTNGVGTFSATLRTAGSQTITATDTTTSSITGASNTFVVSLAPTQIPTLQGLGARAPRLDTGPPCPSAGCGALPAKGHHPRNRSTRPRSIRSPGHAYCELGVLRLFRIEQQAYWLE